MIKSKNKIVPDARKVASDILGAVLDRKIPLDTVLSHSHALKNLSSRERAFARLLVMTVLRRRGQIDAALDEKLARKLSKHKNQIRNTLRLGVAQLSFLETPAHAAVNGSVKLISENGNKGFTGLVNAVLRTIDREGAKALSDTTEAKKKNLPEWLLESWQKAYGDEITISILEAHLKEPPIDLTLSSGSSPEDWANMLEANVLPGGSLRKNSAGKITELEGFNEGKWWVQDVAASLPARLFGNLTNRNIIDLCAAPGGKTAQLASAGANVIAIDISSERLRLVQQNMNRLGLSIKTVCADARKYKPPKPVDAVLLDAPCSATGTIRRHPDIPWLKKKEDLIKTSLLQKELLNSGISMLVSGGILVYAVCSLQPEEGKELIESFIQEKSNIVRSSININELPDLGKLSEKIISPCGDIRTLPCHFYKNGGMDGFYIARLQKL